MPSAAEWGRAEVGPCQVPRCSVSVAFPLCGDGARRGGRRRQVPGAAVDGLAVHAGIRGPAAASGVANARRLPGRLPRRGAVLGRSWPGLHSDAGAAIRTGHHAPGSGCQPGLRSHAGATAAAPGRLAGPGPSADVANAPTADAAAGVHAAAAGARARDAATAAAAAAAPAAGRGAADAAGNLPLGLGRGRPGGPVRFRYPVQRRPGADALCQHSLRGQASIPCTRGPPTRGHAGTDAAASSG
mmetsp:Transcript_108703/g.325157  ORF Transcript_108703/g.325157 Transcript_108703/m.325157 type:complete len:243 (+) Transcript_108703:652-1380(+)